LICILAISLVACSAAPQDVLDGWQQAMNKGDIDQALAYLAEDAEVTIVPAFDGDGIYNGGMEIRRWYEMLASGKGITTLSDCKAQDETVACLDTYTDEGLKSMGVDFLEADFVAVVRDGKIQSYTVTMRPESLAKMPPAPEEQPTTVAVPALEETANLWTEALAEGNIDAALSYLAEDAVVAIVPPGQDGDGNYTGHAEIRGWYDTIVAAKGVGALSNCKTDGEKITCLNTYSDEGLKAMGVDFIEGEWAAVISDGKIQSYTCTITPESLAKFPPPPEVRINSTEAITGNWEGQNGAYLVWHDFRADGSLSVKLSGVGLISNSRYWFEDDLLKVEDTVGDCEGMVGNYEVYATYEGEEAVQLRFVLVGEDACSDRKETWAGQTMSRK
jgi:ketosteroid isomerase-like protein